MNAYTATGKRVPVHGREILFTDRRRGPFYGVEVVSGKVVWTTPTTKCHRKFPVETNTAVERFPVSSSNASRYTCTEIFARELLFRSLGVHGQRAAVLRKSEESERNVTVAGRDRKGLPPSLSCNILLPSLRRRRTKVWLKLVERHIVYVPRLRLAVVRVYAYN